MYTVGRRDGAGRGSGPDPRGNSAATEFLEDGIDFDRANTARVYDYLLGGAHNFAVDRDRADALVAAVPALPAAARANRGFLGRVVDWCAHHGIDQFLDLGSGVPTVGNVHEIAARTLPAARVAYVDHDPVAVAHAEQILAGLATVSVGVADLREPDTVLTAPGVTGLLDLDRPVALLATSVLHHASGDLDAAFARYRAVLPAGSVVALSHASDDQDDPELAASVRLLAEVVNRDLVELVLRDRAAIAALVTGLEPVPPGLVDIAAWPVPGRRTPSGFYGVVAVVPGSSAS